MVDAVFPKSFPLCSQLSRACSCEQTQWTTSSTWICKTSNSLQMPLEASCYDWLCWAFRNYSANFTMPTFRSWLIMKFVWQWNPIVSTPNADCIQYYRYQCKCAMMSLTSAVSYLHYMALEALCWLKLKCNYDHVNHNDTFI